jgi:hypothetical protein
MMLTRIVSVILRVLQLASAAIVAGIIGDYLHDLDKANYVPGGRFVYTIVIASFSLLASLILLIPFTASLTIFPLDLLFFILWIISFGLLVDWIAPMDCQWYRGHSLFYLSEDPIDQCQRWKAGLAFTFLSAMFWLGSAILALWVVHRSKKRIGERRRWYRSHY